jgi:hypothetical protein
MRTRAVRFIGAIGTDVVRRGCTVNQGITIQDHYSDKAFDDVRVMFKTLSYGFTASPS